MLLAEADMVAAEVVRVLDAWCERICVAGSVRRRRPEVKDIEVVCIPKTSADGLFGQVQLRDPGFVAAVRHLGYLAKGDPETGRYCKVIRPDITLDIFIARPDNWGFILAIRTGSAGYSHRVLGRGWRKANYHAVDGMILRNWTNRLVVLKEEEDLFQLIGLEWVAPEEREIDEEVAGH